LFIFSSCEISVHVGAVPGPWAHYLSFFSK